MLLVLQVCFCLSINLGASVCITSLPKFELAHQIYGVPSEPFWIDIYGHAKVETVRAALSKYKDRYPLALAFASAAGNIDVARYLVRRYGYGRSAGSDPFDEFMAITEKGHVIRTSTHQPPSYYDADRRSEFRANEAYLVAAANGHLNVMKFLEVDFTGLHYEEALRLATLRGHMQLAHHLITKHSLHIHSKLCREAAKFDHLDFLKFLISTVDDPDRQLRFLAAAYLGAFETGRLSIMEFITGMCELEEPRLSVFRLKMKLIDMASKEDNADVIRYLFSTGSITTDDVHMINQMIPSAGEKVIHYLHFIGVFEPINYTWLLKACREDNVALARSLASHGYKIMQNIHGALRECFASSPWRLKSGKVFMFLVLIDPTFSTQDIIDCLRLDKSGLKPHRARRINDALFKMAFKKHGWDAYALIKKHPQKKCTDFSFLRPLLSEKVCISRWASIDIQMDAFVKDNLSELVSITGQTIAEAIHKRLSRFEDPVLQEYFETSLSFLSTKQLLEILKVAINDLSSTMIVRALIHQEVRLSKRENRKLLHKNEEAGPILNEKDEKHSDEE